MGRGQADDDLADPWVPGAGVGIDLAQEINFFRSAHGLNRIICAIERRDLLTLPGLHLPCWPWPGNGPRSAGCLQK